MTKFLSPQQLAQMLEISTKTVYGWIYTKQVPYFKIGRLVRFNLDEISKWLSAMKINPSDKLQ